MWPDDVNLRTSPGLISSVSSSCSDVGRSPVSWRPNLPVWLIVPVSQPAGLTLPSIRLPGKYLSASRDDGPCPNHKRRPTVSRLKPKLSLWTGVNVSISRSSINAILCSITGSRSPSLAARRIVSAMAWTCEQSHGSGSDATATIQRHFHDRNRFRRKRPIPEKSFCMLELIRQPDLGLRRSHVTPTNCFRFAWVGYHPQRPRHLLPHPHRHRGKAAPRRAAVPRRWWR